MAHFLLLINMAHLKMSSILFSPIQNFCTLITTILLVLPHANSLDFNFSRFHSNHGSIFYEGDSSAIGGKIQLTRDQQNSIGRASYFDYLPLWSSKTRQLADFTTHFTFRITELGDGVHGDGFTFFLAPFDSRLPNSSVGGCLGLVHGVNSKCFNPSNSSQVVAVEFDNLSNKWDPLGNHVGIDVGSVISNATATWDGGFKNGTVANAWITYNSTSFNLSVFLTFDENPVFTGESILSYPVDLRTVLPENVRIGFSAATGDHHQASDIISWEFNADMLYVFPDYTPYTLINTTAPLLAPAPAPAPSKSMDNTTAPAPSKSMDNTTAPAPSKSRWVPAKVKNRVGLIGGLVAGVTVISFALLTVGFVCWKKRSIPHNDEVELDLNDEFERGTGPRRFTYGELSRATNNFAEDKKLGQGGFGGVYFGELTDPKTEVAVKKVSKGSKQGKKEYVAEVKTISRLRHKNLVQLLGWCHEHGDFLLVYEFTSNGSLDSHLYRGKRHPLPWTVRYKIANDLSSVLLYLHEDWEQCVLHRDIKSSNVMLDSNFNAKLGDFGLARMVDHHLGSQTTELAGTLGYLAPECAITGKASKESDVYSYGVVALELACGRRPIDYREEPVKVRMISWVWDLYGKGLLPEAMDQTLEEGGFNVQEVECLMIVGLWCCHPDPTHRPSIRQVMKVLKAEAPLPDLPSTMPIPSYSTNPMRADVAATWKFSGSYLTEPSVRS